MRIRDVFSLTSLILCVLCFQSLLVHSCSLNLPSQTRGIHASSSLDVEPRRIIFDALPLYTLNLNADSSEKEFDVDGAKAEWRVREGRLAVYV